MDWLVLVHVGPVQDFIMSARRCRDLWFGSQLLSELSKAVALSFEGALAPDRHALIFPGSLDADESGVANKIVVRVKSGDAARCKALAEQAREAMLAYLERIAISTFNTVEQRGATDAFQRERALEHVRHCMEFMWVAVPVTETYSSARQRGEQLLAARKNTRNWSPLSIAPAGIPKSSLDGVRESVLHESLYDRRSKGYVAPPQRHKIYSVKGEERLCGIGLLKRVGQLPTSEGADSLPVFHSSGHMASAGVRRRLALRLESSDSVELAYDRWCDALEAVLGEDGVQRYRIREAKSSWETGGQTIPSVLPFGDRRGGLDGILLYPSRLNELRDIDLDRRGEGLTDLAVLEETQKALLKALKVSDPYPYYAILVADGDNMGRAIDRLESPEKHRQFSEQLDQRFSQGARKVVESHGGTLIFSGGDDVIALLPIFSMLDASRGLRDLFNEAMAGISTAEHAPTLSVGLGIGHFMTPFAEVRALAKHAEGLAKNNDRNSLAISWKKRGGPPREAVDKWTDTPGSLDRRLIALADLMAEASIPRGFSHQLLEVLNVADETAADGTHDAMLLSLATRVIRRRQLSKPLEERFIQQLLAGSENTSTATHIRNFANELLLANELRIARQEALLGPTPDSAKEAAE